MDQEQNTKREEWDVKRLEGPERSLLPDHRQKAQCGWSQAGLGLGRVEQVKSWGPSCSVKKLSVSHRWYWRILVTSWLSFPSTSLKWRHSFIVHVGPSQHPTLEGLLSFHVLWVHSPDCSYSELLCTWNVNLSSFWCSDLHPSCSLLPFPLLNLLFRTLVPSCPFT
jgi:hypothetical protein